MKVCDNGICRDMTDEEMAAMEQSEAEYWRSIGYDEAVNDQIRKRYSESAEFAILRQKADKPEEYAAYYGYCEECKALVKAKKGSV